MLLRAKIASVLSPPIKTLSGFSRSFIAEPSAKNSGFDKTSKDFVLLTFFIIWEASNMFFMTSAVFTGNVLFSTTIVCPVA